MNAMIATTLFCLLPLQTTPSSGELSERLYRACIAAARASLELDDVPSARRWLGEAPLERRGFEWTLLCSRSEQSSRCISVGDSVLALDVSPDGTQVATAEAAGGIRLWDAGGEPLRTLTGHEGPAWGVVFSPDGTRLASQSTDGTGRVWNVASGDEELVLEDVGQGVGCVGWSPDGARLATCSWKRDSERGVWGVIQVWDAATGERLREIEHGIKPLATLAWSPDGTCLAVGSWDSEVALFSTHDWGAPELLLPPESEAYKAVDAVDFSDDGKLLAVATRDGTARVWNVVERRLVQELRGAQPSRPQPIADVLFLDRGRSLATVGGDRVLRLWDVASGRQTLALLGHSRPVKALAASPDGERLYTAGSDQTLRLWSPGELDRNHWKVHETVFEIAFSPDGTRAATSGWKGWIQIFDVASGAELLAWQGHDESAVRVAWSSDGEHLATTGNDGRVRLRHAADGSALSTLLDLGGGQIISLAFSSDAARVAAPTRSGAVAVWSLPEGDLERELPPGKYVWQVGWSPGGELFAVGRGDGHVELWDLAQDAPLRRLAAGRGNASFSFHPSQPWIATAAADGVLKLWELDSGRVRWSGEGHEGAVLGIAFRPDGTRLASASSDRSARLWNVEDGALLLNDLYPEGLWTCVWSPGGDALAVVPLAPVVRLLR